MVDLSVLLRVEVQILLYFFIGVVLKKKKVTSPEIDQFLSVLVLSLIMPMNVFVSFYQGASVEVLLNSLMLIVAGTVVMLVTMGLGPLISRPMAAGHRKIAQYSMLISNGSLIGLPLIYGLCGGEGVFYANIFMIPTRILSFAGGERYFNPGYKGAGFVKGAKNFLLNPITLAMIFGLLLNGLSVSVPQGLLSVCEGLSGCMTPIALILVGSTLADSILQRNSSPLELAGVSLFRLIGSPLLTYFVCRWLGLNTVMILTAVLVNATPVASTATIFAQRYQGDTQFSSRCVFLSTACSFFTLGLVCLTLTGL